MFFNNRKKFNGHVVELLPRFGFDLDEAGVMKTASALDIAWQQKYSHYEAALYVAYLVFAGMLKANEPRAHDVIRCIRSTSSEWVSQGVVRENLASQFSSKADEWIAKQK
ncbi:MAG: hypothetical protein A3E57_07615 [Candidatus Muproteobacteria bacterium RIFCSPHIGHO2_12_FULL_60_33]|uniref:Uncharacterized protein n=1 Tax=Candidatus Muproteobacteria bacterium RIFCSPLOWO2_01_FULL_60_18 TaxID=1817768 RepID=A0A1F6TYX7_9PROT|nr:MAG: hypothetical protein A3A87_09330 [Candidatus Muproteobacteria bacterium RIFCSPLOWO2_01_FULL_60_18]OGI54450.1 MAG: hypothetical protein A3E57_07615 [Candidatus Muproteobacteria bacterium RIFCSPHIGHO2_12_FULL_60_33]